LKPLTAAAGKSIQDRQNKKSGRLTVFVNLPDEF
jgi:hypothetical protein